MLRSVWRWRREYQVSQVDVYSGPAFLWAIAVVGLLRLLRKPVILSLHGGRLPEFSRRWPRMVRGLLNAASVVTAPSRYLVREMEPYRLGIVLLPNPLDVAIYPAAVRSRPRPRIVWLRAFHETYNPSLAPAALALVLQRAPEAFLTMIGPDKGDGSLQRAAELASTLRVSDRIRFVPGIPKDRVAEALSQADIFINTTDADNTPVSVMEAMACGLCVVSTRVGGVPDLLEDGVDAMLVPPRDAKAMAAAVSRVLEDSLLAERLSSGARRKVEAFDWSILLPQWEGLFRAAAGTHG